MLGTSSGWAEPTLRVDYVNNTGAAQLIRLAVALDHGDSTGAGGNSLANNTFCGTSAAVPAIAGAAALLESAGFNRAMVLKALR